MTLPHNISFTSLGLVVLDEIRFPSREPLTDVLGGSGAYATFGARLFLPAPSNPSLGWILHRGKDFPDTTLDLLRSWDTALVVEKELNKPSTRGLLEYKDTTMGPKVFKDTTPIHQVLVSSLKGTPLLASGAYHYLESPHGPKDRFTDLLALRESEGVLKRPLIIWQPAPPVCKAENLQACLDAARMVDVFSPNHLELATLFGKSPSSALDKGEIETRAQRFLDSGVGPEGEEVVVIRAGEHGCVVGARHIPFTWLPTFYKPGPAWEHDAKVVDPTEAGNAFLGAYAIGYLSTGDATEAACYGSVGASFALGQIGIPTRSSNASGELWNGEPVFSRLREYQQFAGLPK
ncbi:pfkB family carbohydrate kinase superfamily [Aspergillus undulatus]|uniref:pfkB family carbohydrate kinase superfamily n=1 Tax=Aspergillus undulatus TaxID=1810928 RepID=UPI003CCD462A